MTPNQAHIIVFIGQPQQAPGTGFLQHWRTSVDNNTSRKSLQQTVVTEWTHQQLGDYSL